MKDKNFKPFDGLSSSLEYVFPNGAPHLTQITAFGSQALPQWVQYLQGGVLYGLL